MWFVVNRGEARPDAADWPGRRLLSALDAIAWPALGIGVVGWLPMRGILCAVPVALCVIVAAHRLRRAIWSNHRYRFTTWRWGRAALALLAIGLLVRGLLRV